MSGVYPTTINFMSLDIESTTNTLVSMAQSGRRNVRQTGTHKWRFMGRYTTLTREQFMPIFAFIMAQEGRFETFDFVPPDLATPQGNPSGSPTVNGASQTGTSLITQAWQASTLIFKAGDVFKCNGHNKVYMITEDITSDGLGNATLKFQPPLVQSPVDLEDLTVTNVPFKVQLMSDLSKYSLTKPILYDFSVEFIEVI